MGYVMVVMLTKIVQEPVVVQQLPMNVAHVMQTLQMIVFKIVQVFGVVL